MDTFELFSSKEMKIRKLKIKVKLRTWNEIVFQVEQAIVVVQQPSSQ